MTCWPGHHWVWSGQWPLGDSSDGHLRSISNHQIIRAISNPSEPRMQSRDSLQSNRKHTQGQQQRKWRQEYHTWSMQTDRRLQTGACTWQTGACTRQTRMQTSRQQLVLGRQADRYRASPVNMIAMLCPWHCSMNHWFLPLLNLSSKPYNFCIKSICWSCNYTSPLGVTLDTGNYIRVMRTEEDHTDDQSAKVLVIW